MFGCKHKFGKIEEDGYQYCEKCGKAFKPECVHNWEIISRSAIERWGNDVGILYGLKCKYCGDIKQVRTGIETDF